MDYTTKEVKKGTVLQAKVDNSEYIKNAPENFKEACAYLKEQSEAQKDEAVKVAAELFKKNKKTDKVEIVLPFGYGKNDTLNLTFQRSKEIRNMQTGETSMRPTVAQKPKTSLMGGNTHFTNVKKSLVEIMG
jgi:ribosomal protein L1